MLTRLLFFPPQMFLIPFRLILQNQIEKDEVDVRQLV
jgi:hypothetical protein